MCSLGTKQLTKFSEQGTLSGLKVVVGSPFLVLLSMLLFQVVIQSCNFCQSLGKKCVWICKDFRAFINSELSGGFIGLPLLYSPFFQVLDWKYVMSFKPPPPFEL